MRVLKNYSRNDDMISRYRALLTIMSTLILSISGLFVITNVASGSTPAEYDSGTATCTTDASGYCNGPTLPFTPNAVTVTVQDPMGGVPLIPSQVMAKIITNSFRARFLTPSGGMAAGVTVTFSYFATRGPTSTPTATSTTTSTATTSTATATTTAPTTSTTTSTATATTATTTSTTTSPAPLAKYPAQVLNLTNWKQTLPIDTSYAGSPDEYKQPALNTFSMDPYFKVNPASDGVMFQANAGGFTTSGSGYPRSELREMTSGGSASASWSNTSGTHTMVVDEALTAMTLVAKPQVVTAQIHDSANDIIEIMADKVGSKLNADGSFGICVRFNGTEQSTCLDNRYVLGTRYVVKLVASGGHIIISYNGVQKFNFTQSGSGWYFKAGSYVQSNTSKGDLSSAYGRVTIYGLQVTHT